MRIEGWAPGIGSGAEILVWGAAAGEETFTVFVPFDAFGGALRGAVFSPFAILCLFLLLGRAIMKGHCAASRWGNGYIEIKLWQCQMRAMNILADPLNLIFLAVALIAGFRLWRVLGQRPGAEQPAPLQEYHTKPMPTDLELNAEVLPPRNTWQGHAPEGSALAKQLEEIGARDPQFNGNEFLAGAKSAHETILNGFAAGDLEVLKTALTPNTFTVFETEITRRKAAGETAIFKFVSNRQARIENIQMLANQCRIEIAFMSSVFSAIKNSVGEVISGSEKRAADIDELWTFERNLSDTSSNWRLAETHELIDHV